jgi:hypothetical protein
MSRRQKSIAFQRLTCIQQTGTKRETNGAVCYTFVAEVNHNLPAVRLTLTVSPALVLFAEAVFDKRARQELDTHSQEEEQAVQPALLDAS